MKKYIFILFAFVLPLSCTSINKPSEPNNTDQYKAPNNILSGWSLYSTGLFYKNTENYNKAIKYFMDAAAFQEELDKVYYQLAECYYYMYNYNTAIMYAKMAIKADKRYFKPYLLLNRVYSDINNNKKAVEILEELVNIYPEMINIHYSIGLTYYNRLKDNDKALVSFRNIIELANAVPVEDYYKENANYYIGRIYYSKNLFDKSVEHLEKTIEINSDNKAALYLLSNILMELYQLDDAKEYSLQYLSKFEANNVIYANLGRIYYIEDNPRAMEYLGGAMSSNDIYGVLCKSLYYELIRKDKEAASLLKTISLDNSLLISPHIALGRIALRKGDKKTASGEFFTAGVILYKSAQYDAARAQLTQVLTINEKIPEVYFYLGKIYEETQNINLAIVNFKKTNKMRPTLEVQIHIGYLYSQLNNFENAAQYIDAAIKQEPNNPKPYFFKGLALSRNNEFPEAEILFRKAIELKQDDDTYYFYLATVQEKQNKIDDTIKSLKKAIEYNPENAMVFNYLGYLYAENNINLDESIELIQKALAIAPSNGAYLDSLGWAYYKKGDIKLALKKLLLAEKRLDKEKSPDPVVYDHIGDAYKKMGETEKAVEYWKKSVDLQKNSKIEEKIKNPLMK
ncbi:MAG: tetratricopeptide repeat protein [Spirochaetes bacterium]|nr:tetratricopeptide repeat protein [Spirochaetota bacterium]